jgi:outer membrane immunogenic protein
MITMIRTTAVAAGLVLAAGTAFAADIYTPPPEPIPVVPTIDWTGFYTGLNAGWGWGDGDGSTSYTPNPGAFGAAPFSSSMSLDGFVGGAQAGYNWQWDSFVGGVEADIQYSDMSGSHRVAPLRVFGGGTFPGSFQNASGDIDWFATVRLRGGFLVSPAFLLYATGGFAFGDVSYSTFTRFAGAPTLRYPGSGSDTATGWTVGGGAEWKFAPNWSAKLEYLYFDLGNTDYVVSSRTPAPPFRVTQDFDTTGSIVRVGVNYHFSSY